MGQGQDPYGDAGDFTPYQPDATPDGEPSAAPEPFTPYDAGSAHPSSPVPVKKPSSAAPWLIGVGVLVLVCGGAIAAIVAGVSGNDSITGEDTGAVAPEEMQVQILANDLEAGQCLIGAGLDPSSASFAEGVSGLEVVRCTTAHDAEVIAVNVLDSEEAAAYDFDDSNGAFESCRAFFSPEQQKLLNRDDLFLIALTESATPTKDDKVACLLANADGAPLHGSFNDPPASHRRWDLGQVEGVDHGVRSSL